MKKEIVKKLRSKFEQLIRTEEDTGVEFWLARDLQTVLEYARWENFINVIAKAKTACENSGYEIKDHFLDVTKMVELGSGAIRKVDDIALSRYACFLINNIA